MKVLAFITESGEYFYRPSMLFGLDFRVIDIASGRKYITNVVKQGDSSV